MTGQISALAAATGLTGSELLEVSQKSTTVRKSAATISAQASDNSFNDSGAGFLAAGFAVNDRVNVEGFTGNTANNLLVGTITALTASKMTIGGTDGDVIVDDAAGETVVISKWVSRRTTADDIAGVSADIPSGTAFPGSPASGDLFRRLDDPYLGMVFRYDGTRWLSVQVFISQADSYDSGGPRTTTGVAGRGFFPLPPAEVYITKAWLGAFLTGTGNWTVNFTINGVSTAIGSAITAASTVNQEVAINAVAADGRYDINTTENSGTATLYCVAGCRWRRIAT